MSESTKTGDAKPDWWEDKYELAHIEEVLVRANVLPQEERAYFREKPWKWDKERSICRRLERIMIECGVMPAEGWKMSLLELSARSVGR